jgi:hypothetical protein
VLLSMVSMLAYICIGSFEELFMYVICMSIISLMSLSILLRQLLKSIVSRNLSQEMQSEEAPTTLH